MTRSRFLPEFKREMFTSPLCFFSITDKLFSATSRCSSPTSFCNIYRTKFDRQQMFVSQGAIICETLL